MGDWNMEQGCCPVCGSEYTKMTRIDKDVNVLVWYECAYCGQVFIECYAFDSKGVPSE